MPIVGLDWNYSGDPGTSPLDQLRFLLGDTNPNMPQMSDAELIYILMNHNNDMDASVVECCEHLVAYYAPMVDYTIGPEKVAASKRFEQYTKLLKRFQDRLRMSANQIGLSCSTHEPLFNLGMHDNTGGGTPGLDD